MAILGTCVGFLGCSVATTINQFGIRSQKRTQFFAKASWVHKVGDPENLLPREWVDSGDSLKMSYTTCGRVSSGMASFWGTQRIIGGRLNSMMMMMMMMTMIHDS